MKTSQITAGGFCPDTAIGCHSARGTTLGTRFALFLIVGITLTLSGCRSCGSKVENDAEASQPQDPIAQCRELAPDDPYEDDEEGAEMAYASCFEAVQRTPEDAELIYLLGTSAFQSKRMDEASENFRKADHLGYCKAIYFLGEDAWYGHKDAKSAEEYYKRGAACGDKRAVAELFTPVVFEQSAHPDLIEALYNSDIEKLNKVRFASASYIAGFYEALGEQYQGKDMDTCWKSKLFSGGEITNQLQAAEKGDASNFIEGAAYEYMLPKAFQVLLPAQGSQSLEDFRKAERAAGSGDELRMVENSKCGALMPSKIVTGIKNFAKSNKSLLQVIQSTTPNVRSLEDIPKWLQQKGSQATR